MNNLRKYTSEEYAEVRLWRDELPITFLLGLPKDNLAGLYCLENRIFYLGIQQTVTQILNFLVMMLDKQVWSPYLLEKCNWRSPGYFSEPFVLSWVQVDGSSHILDSCLSRHLPGVFINWPPSTFISGKSESVLKYLLEIPSGTKKKRGGAYWVFWRSWYLAHWLLFLLWAHWY